MNMPRKSREADEVGRSALPKEDVAVLLGAFGAATVHEAYGGRGAVCSAIKPIDPHMRLAGRALTVDAAPADNLVIHAALLRARPGDILVVDAKGYVEAGPWGDMLTEAALALRVGGLVIDGAVRDAQAIIDADFPVFSRGLSIKGTAKNQAGRIGGSMIFGGVEVRTGDIVVGDRDGIVFVASDEAMDVLAAARARAEKEDHMRQAIRDGRTTVDLLGLQTAIERLDSNYQPLPATAHD